MNGAQSRPITNIPTVPTGTGASNPVPVDPLAGLDEHVQEVREWLNGGALIWIRLAEVEKRAAMLDELAAVLCSAAVATANAASALSEAAR